jgi:hypothetical protein
MANQKVLEYIERLLSQGYHIEDIEKRLLDAGWPRERIEECIDIIYDTHPEPPEIPVHSGTGKPRIKSNFPTLIKPKLMEDVYRPPPPPKPPAEKGKKPKEGSKAGAGAGVNKFLVLGIVIVALAALVFVAGSFVLFFWNADEGTISVIGLTGFDVPADGALYAGATGNLRLTLKNADGAVIVENVSVEVDGVEGLTSPGILMGSGEQNNFLISGLPVLQAGQSYTASIDVSYRNSETGMEMVSAGTITGRVN